MMRARLLAILALPALLAACAGPAPAPKEDFYLLEVPAAATHHDAPVLAGTLGVNRLIPAGVVGDRAMAYAQDDAPGRLRQYGYRYWSDTPAELLADAMVTHLRATGVAERVVGPTTRTGIDYALEGRLLRFDQLEAGKQSQVHVRMELSLTRRRDGGLMLLKTYDATAPASESPASLVEGFGQAVGQILNQLDQDLAAADGG